jgi:hypothetical protein
MDNLHISVIVWRRYHELQRSGVSWLCAEFDCRAVSTDKLLTIIVSNNFKATSNTAAMDHSPGMHIGIID